MTFEELGLSEHLLKSIKGLKYTAPTEIQEKTIPLALEGKDITAESATGSGKTLAFGCAILEKVEAGKGVQGLVLTPTREIAAQVTKVLRGLAWGTKLNIIEVYGGVGYNPQIDGLKRADVVVATPGRILDHFEQRTIDVSSLKILVLDEADRMLDMGFIDDVERIIEYCPRERQTLFFSATLADPIKQLSRNHMHDPVHVQVGNRVDPTKLNQVYYDIDRRQKFSLLCHLLKQEQTDLVMIFCNTKRMVDQLATNLKKQRFSARAIHGGLTQAKRRSVLKSFHEQSTEILVCTDVAARGLDIAEVSHVYNYDIPDNPTEYVHRIGRTARAGAEGIVINFISPPDYDAFQGVMQITDGQIKLRDTPQYQRISFHVEERGGRRGGGRGGPRGRSSGSRSGHRRR